MKARPNPRRKLLLALRRRVKVQRRFDVVALGDGKERQTCRTCGHQIVCDPFAPKGRPGSINPALAERLSAYRNSGSGVSGICPKCSRDEADRLYPLPP